MERFFLSVHHRYQEQWQVLLKVLSQVLERSSDLLFHSFKRNAELVSDLPVFEMLIATQLEDSTTLVGQAVYGSADFFFEKGIGKPLLKALFGNSGGILPCVFVAHLLLAEGIEAAVTDRGKEIAAEVHIGRKGILSAPEGQKQLLNNLPGDFRISDNGLCIAQQGGKPGAKKYLKGDFVLFVEGTEVCLIDQRHGFLFKVMADRLTADEQAQLIGERNQQDSPVFVLRTMLPRGGLQGAAEKPPA